jgi:hypothetical protein
LLQLRFLWKTGYPSSCICSYFYYWFTKLLEHIALDMVNAHGKFGRDTIHNGSGRSNQISSHVVVNLLSLQAIFFCQAAYPSSWCCSYFFAGLRNCWHIHIALGMVSIHGKQVKFICQTAKPLSCSCTYFNYRFTKLLARIVLDMLNIHG